MNLYDVEGDNGVVNSEVELLSTDVKFKLDVTVVDEVKPVELVLGGAVDTESEPSTRLVLVLKYDVDVDETVEIPPQLVLERLPVAETAVDRS